MKLRASLFVIAILPAAILLPLANCASSSSATSSHDDTNSYRHVEPYITAIMDYVEGQADALCLPLLPPTSSHLRWLQHTEGDMVEEINEFAHEMHKRRDRISALASKRYVSEDSRGYLSVASSADLASSDERNVVQRVVAAENKDRKDLYQEVARLAKNVTVSAVEQAFARVRAQRAAKQKEDAPAPVLTPS